MTKTEKIYWEKKSLEIHEIGNTTHKAYNLFVYDYSYKILHLKIIDNPFFNCQTFTIGNIQTLLKLQNHSFIITRVLYFILFELKIEKRQIVIDIENKYKAIARQVFNPYINSIQEFNYCNQNGSNMCLMIIQLNNSKLQEKLYTQYHNTKLSKPDRIRIITNTKKAWKQKLKNLLNTLK